MIVDEGGPDLFKFGLMLATLAIYSTGRKIPEPLLVLAAALIGLAPYRMLYYPCAAAVDPLWE
jgi:hypothetical protein